MTAPTKWKLVPVEPPQSLIDEACHEHDPGVMCLAKLNFVERWKRVISAASPAPGVVDIARNGVDEVIKLTREVNDLALLCARLVKRLRAAREGKGSAIGDAQMEMTVIKYLTRHGLHHTLWR